MKTSTVLGAALACSVGLSVPRAAAATEPLTIVEYSDYECPYCARAHADLRAAVARRPDVRIEHRNFPLDSACNSSVRRPLHRDACMLARAAVCADEQGRLWQMNDALYGNQRARRPVDELARDAGLDVARLRDCMRSPRAAERVASEIAAGIAAGVGATPTYVVRGAVYTGTLPPSVLAPELPKPGRGKR